MQPVLNVLLASMQADIARVQRAGMNIANAQTPGFKRELAQAEALAAPNRVDLRPGTLKATGSALDVALVGDAWFEVATPEGTAYTRQGNFRLDAGGRLVTQQGHPVMGHNGEIRLLQGTPLIDPAGRVFEGAGPADGRYALAMTPVAQLRLWQFDASAQGANRLGNGLFAMPADGRSASEGSVQVLQGHLENSNVNPMQEMVRLVEAVRHVETLQRVATSYDEMLAQGIRRLGEA